MIDASAGAGAQDREKEPAEGWHGYKLPKDSLTPREADICRLFLEGHALKEVAGQLGVSTSTASCHARNLYTKLGVHSRAELFKRFNDAPMAAVRESPREPDHVRMLDKLDRIESRLEQIVLALGLGVVRAA